MSTPDDGLLSRNHSGCACCCVQDDERMLQDIQRFYSTVIEELPSNVADLI